MGDAAVVVDAARKEMAQSAEPWAEGTVVAEDPRNTSADSVVIANLAQHTYGAGRVQMEKQLTQESSIVGCDRILGGMDATFVLPP